jgi:hypothetical protein
MKRRYNVNVDIGREQYLDEYGYHLKSDAPLRSRARADFTVHIPSRLWTGFFDVTIHHPSPTFSDAVKQLADAEEDKNKRYYDNYNITPTNFFPLAFSPIGGWSRTAKESVMMIIRELTGNADADTVAKEFRTLQYRVAAAHARSHGAILAWTARKNHSRGNLTDELGDPTPEEAALMEAHALQEEHPAPEGDAVAADPADGDAQAPDETDPPTGDLAADAQLAADGSDDGADADDTTDEPELERVRRIPVRRSSRRRGISVRGRVLSITNSRLRRRVRSEDSR